MKWARKFRPLELAAVSFVAACDTSWAIGGMRDIGAKADITKLTRNQKTVCVGRYLVDVPSETRVLLAGVTASVEEKLRVTKLRSHKRNINGLSGEEEIERVREYIFTTGYSFNSEVQRRKDDVLFPYLSLGMETGLIKRPGGELKQTCLREVAPLALWDSISSSVRLRKVDPAPTIPMADFPSSSTLQVYAPVKLLCNRSGAGASATLPAKPLSVDSTVNLVQNRP